VRISNDVFDSKEELFNGVGHSGSSINTFHDKLCLVFCPARTVAANELKDFSVRGSIPDIGSDSVLSTEVRVKFQPDLNDSL
jgi:hypothetical protein